MSRKPSYHARVDERTPRLLPERTGRHICTLCMREVDGRVYLANDHVCEDCARREEERLMREEDEDGE